MKISVKWSILGLLLVMSMLLSGCTLVSVNPERDNAEVIATVNGEDITKEVYNNNLAYLEMSYDASDQQMPTGSSLKTLKENLLDTIVRQKVFAQKAKDSGDTIDEEKAKTDANESFNQIQEELGEDKYQSVLESNYVTDESFKNWIEQNAIEAAYSQKATDKYNEDFDADPSKILDESVGTINGEDVTRGQYEYGLIQKTLEYYDQNQEMLPSDDRSMASTNKSIFEEIEDNRANIHYCEENKIDITDDAINTQVDTLKNDMSRFFSDDQQIDDFIKDYFLTRDAFNQWQKEEAKGLAAKDAIQTNFETNAEVSESEIKKYYDDHIKEYDTTEVSAMHILAQEKDAAQSIYEEAKDITTKEEFQTLIDKYQDVEGIDEATDLGAFDYGTMVKEFSDAAFDADVNTVVGPVQTEYGYHVIYVYDRKDGETKSLDDVKSEIETTLKTEQGDEDFEKLETDITRGTSYDIPSVIDTPLENYYKQLEEEYSVETYPNNIRA